MRQQPGRDGPFTLICFFVSGLVFFCMLLHPGYLRAQSRNELPTIKPFTGTISTIPGQIPRPNLNLLRVGIKAVPSRVELGGKVNIVATLMNYETSMGRVSIEFFQDGKPLPSTGQSVEFIPSHPGRYFFHAVVNTGDPIEGNRPGAKSDRIIVEVVPAMVTPSIPGPRVVAPPHGSGDSVLPPGDYQKKPMLGIRVIPDQIEVGGTAELVAELRNFKPFMGNVTYQFFVNGNQYGPQGRENRILYIGRDLGYHTFTARAYISGNPDLSFPPIESPPVKLKVFARQNTPPPSPPPPPHKLHLYIDRNPLPEGDPCTISTVLDPADVLGPVSYTFKVGGYVRRTPQDWMSCPSLAPGHYDVSAVAHLPPGNGNRQVSSKVVRLRVDSRGGQGNPPSSPPPDISEVGVGIEDIMPPLIGIIIGIITFLIMRPHPSQVAAKVPNGLEAKLTLEDGVSRIDPPSGSEADFHFVLRLDRGVQQLTSSDHKKEG